MDNSKVMVLIDGGVTHNFIDEEFMRKKGFKTQEFPGFEGVFGNRSTTSSNRMVENVKVKFGEYVVTSDFYILPLGGLPHLVLGVQ